MIVFQNIVFDYNGEYFPDGKNKLSEVSIPVIVVMSTGMFHYPKNFTMYELDELTGQIKSHGYDTQPFYTGASRNFTSEPKYTVPAMFAEYVKENEHERL